MINNKLYMRRCFDLARLGHGKVYPNPMVGSVLLHNDKIIGEGYHQQFGKEHAEVNCFNSILPLNDAKIPESVLFVSLEPCCFHGKTPACTDLILRKGVTDLRISAVDKTPKVNGMGLEILNDLNVVVKTNILETTGNWFVRYRTTFVTKKRPYIILKCAVSEDGFIGQVGKNIWLTNPISKRLVHKWRSEIGAIMVGTNTALTDNPRLDNRYFYGNNPLRIVPDRHQKIPADARLKDGSVPTWILVNPGDRKTNSANLDYLPLHSGEDFLPALFNQLVEANIDTLLVEGGATLLQSFLDAGYWDEARIFHTSKVLDEGIPVPEIKGTSEKTEQIGSDRLVIKYRTASFT